MEKAFWIDKLQYILEKTQKEHNTKQKKDNLNPFLLVVGFGALDARIQPRLAILTLCLINSK